MTYWHTAIGFFAGGIMAGTCFGIVIAGLLAAAKCDDDDTGVL